MLDFNPRTHRGVRQRAMDEYSWTTDISIHAPIVGCDMLKQSRKQYKQAFQSTHPSWGATRGKKYDIRTSSYFNPRTHRGVRPVSTYERLYAETISIHAPIVGCDTGNNILQYTAINFNPRTHRGVRRY